MGLSDSSKVVINGSPEHLEALRATLSHHEGRREALRKKHGDDFDEFENVRAELDHLGSELHMLTDHAVSLDANFSKYGYRCVFPAPLLHVFLHRAIVNTH